MSVTATLFRLICLLTCTYLLLATIIKLSFIVDPFKIDATQEREINGTIFCNVLPRMVPFQIVACFVWQSHFMLSQWFPNLSRSRHPSFLALCHASSMECMRSCEIMRYFGLAKMLVYRRARKKRSPVTSHGVLVSSSWHPEVPRGIVWKHPFLSYLSPQHLQCLNILHKRSKDIWVPFAKCVWLERTIVAKSYDWKELQLHD